MSRAQISLSLIYHCTDCTWKSESLKLRCSPLPVLRHIHWSFLWFLVWMVTGKKYHLNCHHKQISICLATLFHCFPRRIHLMNSASRVFCLFVGLCYIVRILRSYAYIIFEHTTDLQTILLAEEK